LKQGASGFKQLPFEEISKEQYDYLKERVKPITSVYINEDDFEVESCAIGGCPIK